MSEKSSVFEVGGKEFELVKRGREQAEQVIQLGKWLNQYGLPAVQDMASEEGEVKFSSGFGMIGDIIEALSVDALIDLYVLALGCSAAFANKNFDISDLIDIIEAVYDTQPSIGKVISRFFSQDTSEESSEEQSTPSE